MALAVVFLPLIAALWVGLSSRVISDKKAQWVTSGFMVLAALCAFKIFLNVAVGGAPMHVEIASWVASGSLDVRWALKIDALTAVMLIVVTWVSALVHIYSIGYMSHDPHKPRFMAYLSLFTFFMLMLVTSNNFLQLFLGWEGVGLCSYLLIGFWYKKDSANAAAIKAFVVNRVGDFGFALGIFAIYHLFGSLQFDRVFAMATLHTNATFSFLGTEFHALTLICVLLFIGAMGKSAQLGLHTWLPDAMEGPTPVSALIHAATMVTAGVFLVARCSPLFEHSQFALNMVTLVGGLTCIFAATVAVTQNDIKKVIAYSTCSQLGYMFFACGVGAYAAGVFHLMTHAFFKALLFLGAGSVIHAMSDEQDMRKMGGIYKKIPITYAMMMIGTLAIIGFPPLAGFFSKDMILESAYASGHLGNDFGKLAFWLGIAAATLTSLYSWRLIFMTFHGKTRAPEGVYKHVHESPKVITVPLFLLAVGAVFSGAIGVFVLGMVDPDMAFWGKSIKMLSPVNILEEAHHVPTWVKVAPFVVGLIGFITAYICYIKFTGLPAKIAKAFSPIYTFLLNKWYFDELYNVIFVRPSMWLGRTLWKFFDVKIIDGLGPNGLAALTRVFSVVFSRFQTGYVYHYAFVMLIGVLGIISWYLYVRV
jgi:NADH-quinone oxidoreductase subunit L